MIKLIVSDLDGTLVEDGGGVLNPEYFSVIRGLKAKGIYFCAASGRHASGIEHLFLPVKDEIFYIGGNGTYVGCRGRELYRTEYKTELTRAMIHDMRAAGMEIIVDSSDCVYTRISGFWHGSKTGIIFVSGRLRIFWNLRPRS